MSILFGDHNTDHSNLKMNPGIRKAVTSEVEKRMKSGKGLCERLCWIVTNKVTVEKLKKDNQKKS